VDDRVDNVSINRIANLSHVPINTSPLAPPHAADEDAFCHLR
jgi:hypothetical protein